jgi:hypothetical protein
MSHMFYDSLYIQHGNCINAFSIIRQSIPVVERATGILSQRYLPSATTFENLSKKSLCSMLGKAHHLIPHACSRSIVQQPYSYCLLEDLSISRLVSLALDLNWNIRRPLVLKELLVFWLGGVQFHEVVALPVWSDVESFQRVLPSDKERSSNDAVVSGAIDRGNTEEVLARGFEPGEQPS